MDGIRGSGYAAKVKTFRVTDKPLREGFPGVRDTVVTIAALAYAGSFSRRIRHLAGAIRRGSATQTVRDLDRLARGTLKYTLDPLEVELVQGADVLLERRRGDCDDYTVFLGALALALEIPTKITVVKRPRRRSYHHVFPEFYLDNRWIPLDSTADNLLPGERPKGIAQSRSFKIPTWGRSYGK